MTYTTRANTLRALLMHAGKNDVRFYLNGICMDLDAGRLVATDGHRMMVASGPKDPGKGQHILPRSLIESVLKVAGKKDCELSITLAGSGSEATATATVALPMGAQFGETLIDGRFPDWRRVIPKVSELTGAVGQYYPEYLLDAAKALVIQGSASKVEMTAVAHNGPDKACIVYAQNASGENAAFVVVMPLRADVGISDGLAEFIGG